MARTADPSAATKKAWETRARAAHGSGTASASRGDFAQAAPQKVAVDLSGVDVGSSPSMDAPSPWQSPDHVSAAIDGAARASKEDIAAGKVPLVRLGDPSKVGGLVLAQYQNDGTVLVFPMFFDPAPQGAPFTTEDSRRGLMAHEFGHEAAMRSTSGGTASERTTAVLRPFRRNPDDPWTYDNFAGASSLPSEFIADVYADLVSQKSKPWEDEGGRYAPVYKHVLVIAKKAGLPMPSWLKE